MWVRKGSSFLQREVFGGGRGERSSLPRPEETDLSGKWMRTDSLHTHPASSGSLAATIRVTCQQRNIAATFSYPSPPGIPAGGSSKLVRLTSRILQIPFVEDQVLHCVTDFQHGNSHYRDDSCSTMSRWGRLLTAILRSLQT